MIIGNNNPNQMNRKKYESARFNNNFYPSQNNCKIMQHNNILSKCESSNNAFAILQERLDNGLITIDEFNKRCIELGKRK